jgi:hypothetical protein
MKVKTITRRTYQVTDTDGNTFETTHLPVDDTIAVAIDGVTATVRYLAEDEPQGGWYFDDNDEGEFYGFDPRTKGHRPLSKVAVQEKIAENPGRCFSINKYEHGQVKYYRAGTAVSECEWDTSRGVALYIAPEDAPDAAAYCDGVMEAFTDWCNGAIYGICKDTFVRNDAGEWERTEEDACWNFIGYDHALSARDTDI